MAADDTYAPKSPDLSIFYSAGPTPPAPQLSRPGFQSKNYLHADYKQDPDPEPQTFAYSYSPTSSSSNIPPPVDYHNQPPCYYQQPHQYQQGAPLQFDQPRTFKTDHPSSYSPSARTQYQRDLPQALPPPLDYDHSQAPYQQQPYGQPYRDQHQYNNAPPYPEPHAQSQGAPSSSKSQKSEHQPSDMPPRRAPPPPAPVIDPSPVRTKFPTARIKRIMQADEEVGKVAQQTPIAVGKALELFMIQMVTKSAEVAQEKGSKRVTAAMLKQVVETDEQWDFLRDIVGRVENEKEGKQKAKVESSSDEEIPEPKKRTRGGGRKKKAA